jgi:hypothetical protein
VDVQRQWELIFKLSALNSALTEQNKSLSYQVTQQHKRTLKYGLAHQLLDSLFDIAKESELKRKEALFSGKQNASFSTYEHYAEGIISFLDAARNTYKSVPNPAHDIDFGDKATTELLNLMLADCDVVSAKADLDIAQERLEDHRNTPHSSADQAWFEGQSAALEKKVKHAEWYCNAANFLRESEKRDVANKNNAMSEEAFQQAKAGYMVMLENQVKRINAKDECASKARARAAEIVAEAEQEAARIISDARAKVPKELAQSGAMKSALGAQDPAQSGEKASCAQDKAQSGEKALGAHDPAKSGAKGSELCANDQALSGAKKAKMTPADALAISAVMSEDRRASSRLAANPNKGAK